MYDILNEKWLDALPEDLAVQYENVNLDVISIIAQRIGKIGNLLPSDVQKLSNAAEFAGVDLKKIEDIIAKAAKTTKPKVHEIFVAAAKANSEFAEQFYMARGLSPETFENSEYIKSLVTAIEDQTLGEFKNLSQTMAFKFGTAEAKSLRRTYTDIVDRAIYEIQNGTTDYNTAMRSTIKKLCHSGIRAVDFESGYTRRMDSQIRMNILDGVKQLSQRMLEYNGERFGSDGVELSAHAIAAPDHAPVQGRQFSNEEFEKMQNAEKCTDIDGNEYEAFERPIGQWNCKHLRMPIIIGISSPAYSNAQLEEMKKNSREKYKCTQKQREFETRIRNLRDEHVAYRSSGDELAERQTQDKINKLSKEYADYSEKNGLTVKYDRLYVQGYRPRKGLKKEKESNK